MMKVKTRENESLLLFRTLVFYLFSLKVRSFRDLFKFIDLAYPPITPSL